jgi:protein-S-isoprenylcysteine O-methyltransferase Ste14
MSESLGSGGDTRSADGSLFWRALFAFLALPGMVAFVIPWFLFRPPGAPIRPVAYIPLVIGAALLLWCVRDFYVAGKGTLAPWSPPKRLVTVGLYRYSRNPMYVAVIIILCGWALAFGTRALWYYALAFAIGFHLRVVLFEEPFLAQMHGEEFTAYRSRVRRWF